MSDFDWEESVKNIRSITRDLRDAMDRLDEAFDSVEFKCSKMDQEIIDKVTTIVKM